MKIISQISVFDYEEIEILGDLERCRYYSAIMIKKLIELINKSIKFG